MGGAPDDNRRVGRQYRVRRADSADWRGRSADSIGRGHDCRGISNSSARNAHRRLSTGG